MRHANGVAIEWVVAGTDIAGSIGWTEDQRVSRERGALIAHTLGNAKLLFMEEHIGSLEIGKYADLVVINEIYMTVDKAEIGIIKSVITMTNGNIVYSE